MIDSEVSPEFRRALELPWDASLSICGAAGTGKTTLLRARARLADAAFGERAVLRIDGPADLVSLAFAMLEERGNPRAHVDDVEANALFSHSATPLLGLEWDTLASGDVDPEVPGLRSPERFLDSAFRLICKLRDAAISPKEFLERSLTGATAFYAKPPNFGHPGLLYATKDAYRDSLDVTPEELQRQFRREIDLAKILARLYDEYLQLLERRGLATGRDAVALAIDLESTARRYDVAFVDDAQELNAAQIVFLQRLFGDRLDRVTVAGDPGSAVGTFRGGRAETALALPAERIVLTEQRRSPLAIELACRLLTGDPQRSGATAVPEALEMQRFRNVEEEAASIAVHVESLLRNGAERNQIAVIFRSVADVRAYEEALLDRGIPVALSGDVNVFADRRAVDALALLWNVWDPFRHEYLLRTLSNSWLALSDAAIAALCSEPPDAQRPLFILDDEPSPTAGSRRWDPKRDVRLGWNVLQGDQDAMLDDESRARVTEFRSLRGRWLDRLYTETFETFARAVWSEGLALEGTEGSARARAQQLVLRRLLDRLNAFVTHTPSSTLGDVLHYAAHRATTVFEACEDDGDPSFVAMLSVDAARGRSFDHVVIPDARAGSFPRWYAPDAFLFSPNLGMIPKECVGDARASRTAKFTYYLFRTKARDQYNAEERRAFVYALRRARRSVFVSAPGKATRGAAAPEFLEELRAAR